MKIKSTLALLLLSTLIFVFTAIDKPTTLDQLGNEIFDAINNNDLEKVKSLIVSIEEIETTVNNSDMPEDKKSTFKSQFSMKIKSDMDKTITKIEEGFLKIKENIDSKKCTNGVSIGEITPKTNKLRNLPIELGELEIQYSCKDDIERINVEVIKTESGWRILEKLRLVYKER